MKRASGILMPVSSLPSPYGIGTLGKAAYKFVDFLAEAGQSYWQILPVGPTSYGDSPYQSPSTFAGNPYFIDLDLLIEDGLLTGKEVKSRSFGGDPERVDYGALYENRYPLLALATERGYERDREKVEAFVQKNRSWLPDYALYMALKRHFGMADWLSWPDEDVRLRREEALARYREMLSDDIRFFTYIQYLFFKQWNALRKYTHSKNIKIIGDLPIYVALDSVDVWSSPENFQLDEKNVPRCVAGVPPDYFSEDGQLWGNPLYDYEAMEKDGFGWWIRRIDGAGKLYDVIRIDHFRGFDSYWSVPYGAKTAREGKWVKGPGIRLVGVLRDWFRNIEFIAEDLGEPSPSVAQLLAESGFPGMKVLEFAFSPGEDSAFLPHNHIRNCVCYTGTHDNLPVEGWYTEAAAEERKKAEDYLGLNEKEGYVRGFLRAGLGSVANLFVFQMQDCLMLPASSRMNTPGIPAGNWQWRMKPGAATASLAKKLRRLTALYGRCAMPAPAPKKEKKQVQ